MRFIQCPDTKKMLPEDEYLALHGTDRLTAKAPNPNSAFFGDRHYENLPVMGGKSGGLEVVNSRTQHRRFMKDNKLTTIDDYAAPGGSWQKSEERRNASLQGKDKTRTADVVAAAKQHGIL